jgi:hypothetical protein
MRVGRNDPCPCGSGRKYKKCCLAADSAPGPYSAADREAALDRLGRLRERTELEDQRALADVEFRSPLEGEPDEVPEEEEIADASLEVFDDWFLLDRKGPDGLTPAEAFLRREGDRLAPGEREFIARLSRTELRLYEVETPVPGSGLDLVDPWSGQRWFVRDLPLASELGDGDLLAARLMPGPTGATVVEGVPLVFPEGARDEVLARLRHAWRLGERETPGEAILETAPPVLHALWMQELAGTASSDPCAHVVFDVLDEEALRTALAAHPDLTDDGQDRYTWREVAGVQTVEVGDVEFDGEELVVHLPSSSLAPRARQMIEEAAGPAVRHAWSDDLDEDEEPAADAPRELREVAVDWSDLELAFEVDGVDANSYLDLRTGRTHIVATGSSGDEGSDLSEDDVEEALAEGHLIAIEPLEPRVEHDWMEQFAATVADERLRRRLENALHGRGAFRRFKDVLASSPDIRDQWHAARRQRVYAAMRTWLDDNDVVPTTPVPDWLRPPGAE